MKPGQKIKCVPPSSPLDSKEIKPVNLKAHQPWIFIGRTDTTAEAPKLWPPDMKSQLIGKDPHAGKDWGQEKKWVTEDEMFEWHHWLNGHVFEQTQGDSEGQAGQTCCSSQGCKEFGMSNWTTTATPSSPGEGNKNPQGSSFQNPCPLGQFPKPMFPLQWLRVGQSVAIENVFPFLKQNCWQYYPELACQMFQLTKRKSILPGDKDRNSTYNFPVSWRRYNMNLWPGA